MLILYIKLSMNDVINNFIFILHSFDLVVVFSTVSVRTNVEVSDVRSMTIVVAVEFFYILEVFLPSCGWNVIVIHWVKNPSFTNDNDIAVTAIL